MSKREKYVKVKDATKKVDPVEQALNDPDDEILEDEDLFSDIDDDDLSDIDEPDDDLFTDDGELEDDVDELVAEESDEEVQPEDPKVKEPQLEPEPKPAKKAKVNKKVKKSSKKQAKNQVPEDKKEEPSVVDTPEPEEEYQKISDPNAVFKLAMYSERLYRIDFETKLRIKNIDERIQQSKYERQALMQNYENTKTALMHTITTAKEALEKKHGINMTEWGYDDESGELVKHPEEILAEMKSKSSG
jgi:hypothetical protein